MGDESRDRRVTFNGEGEGGTKSIIAHQESRPPETEGVTRKLSDFALFGDLRRVSDPGNERRRDDDEVGGAPPERSHSVDTDSNVKPSVRRLASQSMNKTIHRTESSPIGTPPQPLSGCLLSDLDVRSGANVVDSSPDEELNVYRLTHHALRRMLGEVGSLPPPPPPPPPPVASSSESGESEAPLRLLHEVIAVMEVADRLLANNQNTWAGLGTETATRLAKLGDEARDYLGQYDLGGAWHAEAFEKNIQLAKVAYANTTRASGHAEEGREGGERSARMSTRISSSSAAAAAAAAAAAVPNACAWASAVMEIKVDTWEDFDTLALDQELRLARSGGGGGGPSSSGVLSETVNAALRRFGLLKSLGVSPAKFQAFLKSLEDEYRSPDYHTAAHAADVTQVVAWLLSQGLFDQVAPWQAFALIVAAAAHDVGHPGLNNAHLVATESEAAQRWNDVSVNENGHLHTALRLLRKHKVFDPSGSTLFSQEEKMNFLALVRRLILATDMEKHTRLVADFVNMAAGEMAGAEGGEDDEDGGEGSCERGAAAGAVGASGGAEEFKPPFRIRAVSEWRDPGLVLCYVLHCADISNPARPFEVANKWGEKVSEEFFKQGDIERALGMRVLDYCDRTKAGTATVAQNQKNFIDFVCKPTIEALTTVLPGAADVMLYHLNQNREKYDEIIKQEQASSC